ncbi:hypothetical protein IWQ60_004218 [Tieghemiomyces parasiticus]|uniref:Major facilitator superfamily (MFS) profile domain-containing protein n=1 Tax=Tieghemiomyces parasiticus TaxID=78921 RepID=A0A9W8ABU2_9FUNG|nr:hypothetical protein IWQ60_004218 [Tieghemiomyces parasiticus]
MTAAMFMSSNNNSTANLHHEASAQPTKRANFFVRALLRHFGDAEYVRTPEQIQRERTFFGFEFKPWFIVPFCVLTQFCCGSMYSWSIYNQPIDQLIYGDPQADMAPTTFYITVGSFGFTSAILGPWLERNAPRLSLSIGTTLFFLGNLITALGLHLRLIALVYIGYGLVGGAGIGSSYVVTVSVVTKWFPSSRGFASGMAVCGFGAGSIAFAKIPPTFMNIIGLARTFAIMGTVYFVVMMLCAQVMRLPPPGHNINGLIIDSARTNPKNPDHPYETEVVDDRPTIRISLIQALTSRDFWLLYFVFMANQLFGLVVISRLSNMTQSLFRINANTAATIVSIDGGFNLFGRIFFATISDLIGRKVTFGLMLGAQCIVLGFFPGTIEHHTEWAYLLISWVGTSCYGGGFSVIPAFLSDMFGPNNISACHGLILTAWSIAAIGGGVLFTTLYDYHTAQNLSPSAVYASNIWWIFGVACGGFFLIFFIRSLLRDRLFPAVPGQIFRLRIFGRTVRAVRANGFTIEILTREQEDNEWEEYLMLCIIKLRLVKNETYAQAPF